MRHISLQDIYIPEEWEDHAAELLDLLRAKTASDRSRAFRRDTNFQIWALLSPILKGLSFEKCFYTEARLGGSGDIDHFRPKSKVLKGELPKGRQHQGYWWLSYILSNFRLCRTESNKRKTNLGDGKVYGKGTSFPLIDPATRAYIEGDDLNLEQVLLLDPTKASDVELLKFTDDGSPISKNSDPKSLESLRVLASIVCYNLIEKAISDRRGHLCSTAKIHARRIVDLEKKKMKGEVYAKREMIEKKAILHEMVQPYSEFSSAVRCVLMQYKTSPSIKKLLGL